MNYQDALTILALDLSKLTRINNVVPDTCDRIIFANRHEIVCFIGICSTHVDYDCEDQLPGKYSCGYFETTPENLEKIIDSYFMPIDCKFYDTLPSAIQLLNDTESFGKVSLINSPCYFQNYFEVTK